MKKYTFKTWTFLVALVFLSACDQNFLNKEPISDALNSEVNAEPLLTAAYDGMYDEYYTLDFLVNGDVFADNAYAGGDNPANFQIDKFTTSSTNGNVQRDWRYLYTNIKNANIVLNYVPEMKDPKLTETRRNEILGEAAFLRAYHYFNLVVTWGDVPIITGVPNNVTEMFPSKKTAAQVYDQIIKDLEYALPKVRTTVPNKGLVSKGTVNALLAKVYAFKPTPDWAKVNQYATEVGNLGYDLVANYGSLFDTTNKNSVEAIWETQNDGSTHYNWVTGMNTPFMWGDWKKFNIPSHTLVKAYDDAGDAVRKNANIKFVTTTWKDDYWPQPVPVIYKYPNADGKSNTMRLRYADVLLLRAEALAQLGQLDNASGAQFFLNKVRKRAGLANTTATNKADLLTAIEKERQLELAFEGDRWFDLVRRGSAVNVMNSAKDGSNVSLGYNVTATKLYFPLPQDEIDRNPNINK
jgi:hypothetical protein